MRHTTEDAKLALSAARRRQELFARHASEAAANPGRQLQGLQNLTPAMLGNKAKPSLATKGADTGTLPRSSAEPLRLRGNRLGTVGNLLLGASANFARVGMLTPQSPPNLTASATEQRVGATKNAFALFKAARGQPSRVPT